MVIRSLFFLLFCIPIWTVPGVSWSLDADNDALWNLSLQELRMVRVTTLPSGTKTPGDKAAAITTVITDSDILAMGATDIDEVLETVPGLHVGLSDQAFGPKYNIRGITSQYNSQTLLLIDGIPITGLFTGNRSNTWGGMPIKAIKRIEVIRGPGSALHGADAFAGVINIITKTSKDIKGSQLGLRSGSFGTRAAWLEHGDSLGDYEIGMVLEYQTSDGWEKIIEADVLGQSGPVSTGVDATELRINISKGDLVLRGGYQGRRDLGLGVGLAPVLDPQGRYNSDRINFDAAYRLPNIYPSLNIESNFRYYHNTQEVATNPTLFPAGIFPDFPEGVIGAPGYKENQVRFDLIAQYGAKDGHSIRFGIGGFWGDIYETTEKKNFYFNPLAAIPFTPKPELTEVADTDEVFLPESSRTSYNLFFQDEWQLANDVVLTSGLRYDHYSDFGDTINPRLALVWAASESITTKLLYGRAFRAPSFVELFVDSNPVVLGNPDLDPETIDSYELAYTHQPSHNFQYSLNIYYFEIDDYIVFSGVPGEIAQNSGNRKGEGGELEIEYLASSNFTLLGNYAYQKNVDKNFNQVVGEAPNRQMYLRSEWRFNGDWTFSQQVNWVGKQQRRAGDERDSVDDYTTVDLILRRRKIANFFAASIVVKNLFDRDVFEPSEPGRVSGDFPMPGRSVYVALSTKF